MPTQPNTRVHVDQCVNSPCMSSVSPWRRSTTENTENITIVATHCHNTLTSLSHTCIQEMSNISETVNTDTLLYLHPMHVRTHNTPDNAIVYLPHWRLYLPPTEQACSSWRQKYLQKDTQDTQDTVRYTVRAERAATMQTSHPLPTCGHGETRVCTTIQTSHPLPTCGHGESRVCTTYVNNNLDTRFASKKRDKAFSSLSIIWQHFQQNYKPLTPPCMWAWWKQWWDHTYSMTTERTTVW